MNSILIIEDKKNILEISKSYSQKGIFKVYFIKNDLQKIIIFRRGKINCYKYINFLIKNEYRLGDKI